MRYPFSRDVGTEKKVMDAQTAPTWASQACRVSCTKTLGGQRVTRWYQEDQSPSKVQ